LLVAVAAAFVLAELVSVPLGMGLQWDEVVYVSQVGHHAPAAYFDPTRAWGIPVLVAPLAFVTSSVVALRVYLAVVAGLGLLAALCAWRRVRPDWQLALAGLLLGGLWTTQFFGPQAMVNVWSALSALAAVGCFVRYVEGYGDRGALTGLGVAIAWMTLVRPSDAVYLSAALMLVALVLRRWKALVVVAAGLVAGSLEWVIEAELRFGGLRSRLHQAAVQQEGFGFHLALGSEWHALNAAMGPLVCRPRSWCMPTAGDIWPAVWWLALPVLVVLGVLAARAAGRQRSAVIAAVCALALAGEYLVMIDDAAARYLLPAYALLFVVVADGLGWLVPWAIRHRPLSSARLGVLALATAALAGHLVSQHLVLDRQVASNQAWESDYVTIAADLAALGVRPPCLLNGEQYLPIAYVMGCSSNGSVSAPAPGQRRVLLVRVGQPLNSVPKGWHRHRLRGTGVLYYTAFLPG
jgi:hypothetical protein